MLAVETMNKALRIPGKSSFITQFKKAFENVLYHMVVIGNTNSGKSSVLNDVIGFPLLNTNERRETTFHWHIRYPLKEHLKQTNPNANPDDYTLTK